MLNPSGTGYVKLMTLSRGFDSMSTDPIKTNRLDLSLKREFYSKKRRRLFLGFVSCTLSSLWLVEVLPAIRTLPDTMPHTSDRSDRRWIIPHIFTGRSCDPYHTEGRRNNGYFGRKILFVDLLWPLGKISYVSGKLLPFGGVVAAIYIWDIEYREKATSFSQDGTARYTLVLYICASDEYPTDRCPVIRSGRIVSTRLSALIHTRRILIACFA